MKNNKGKENKEPSKRGVGRPPFVPRDEDRAVVKLLMACGMSQDRICLRIMGNDGKPICEATLKRHFARELLLAKVEVETTVLTQFMAAIMRGERWAICKYMDQQMWRPESGGLAARPHGGSPRLGAPRPARFPPLPTVLSVFSPPSPVPPQPPPLI